MLKLNQKHLSYDLMQIVDKTNKNILHHAVLVKAVDLVKHIIWIDSDYAKLRAQKDIKGRVPAQCDAASLFKDSFQTVWDSAKSGDIERLREQIALSG